MQRVALLLWGPSLNELLNKMSKIHQLLCREVAQEGSVTEWAQSKGLSRSHVSKVLHGRKQIGRQMIHALGLVQIPSAIEVRQLLGQEVEKAGGQSKWARANGVNRSTVAQVLIGRRDPGPKLLRALKIRLQWTSPQ